MARKCRLYDFAAEYDSKRITLGNLSMAGHTGDCDKCREFVARERQRVVDDTESWAGIEKLGWAKEQDYERIKKEGFRNNRNLMRRLDRFVSAAFVILDMAANSVGGDYGGSDDRLRDALNHTIGLGRQEYLKALENPRGVLGKRIQNSDFVESFSYCF
jgi:hypothetical protein